MNAKTTGVVMTALGMVVSNLTSMFAVATGAWLYTHTEGLPAGVALAGTLVLALFTHVRYTLNQQELVPPRVLVDDAEVERIFLDNKQGLASMTALRDRYEAILVDYR